jgi:hypothetical protein
MVHTDLLMRFSQNRDLSCLWQCKHDQAFSEQIQRRAKVTRTEDVNDAQIMTGTMSAVKSERKKERTLKMGKFWDKAFVKFVRKTDDGFWVVSFPSQGDWELLKMDDRKSTELMKFREVIYCWSVMEWVWIGMWWLKGIQEVARQFIKFGLSSVL